MEVLIVDDDPLLSEYLQAVLRKALKGVIVAAARDLGSALERTGVGEAPDLVLLDLGLPGCSGLEALLRFRSRFPGVRVAVVSANEEPSVIAAALEAGASGFIPKTSKLDVMIAAIRHVAAGGTYVPPG
jgi:DNA-binding NarL/FixJ family response regulator